MPIIEVENLSKLYKLGSIGATTLRESINRRWYRMTGREHLARRVGEKDLMIPADHPQAGPEPNTFWALKDVSFTVEQGEVLGIIGRNGAGKSTLLKVLSRITEPTSGRAVLRGRVGSLLEVGTGFHPELTGRENIFLNGAILGMRKREIEARFDEIVAFAEVERFIDTPIKRYSSGMYVRLAFAVAAHLDPEILIVDEVLAVGDAAFQKKCLGKMKDVSGEGRTVLFVSHNMAAVQNLCAQSLLLHEGRVRTEGETGRVQTDYQSIALDRNTTSPLRVAALGFEGATQVPWPRGTDLVLDIRWPRGTVGVDKWQCDLAFYTSDGIKVLVVETDRIDVGAAGAKGVRLAVPNPGLAPRPLYVDAGLRIGQGQSYIYLAERCLVALPVCDGAGDQRNDVVLVSSARILEAVEA